MYNQTLLSQVRIHGYWKEMFSLFIGAYFIKDNLDIQTFQIIEG